MVYEVFRGKSHFGNDEIAGDPRSAIKDQNISTIRNMSGFPLISVVRLLINTASLKHKKNSWKIREKRAEFGSDGWLLHQDDDAPSQTAQSVKQFLPSKNITVKRPPLYSPDLASFDYFFYYV
ncbi:hypothetical protein TNCV_9711 [Trichonephila clavipes]|nr:hypothetical protein TNCV_9711 [Trichonephila clavipes]